MKKIVFALQVFGFVASVPIYVITELIRSPASPEPTTTSAKKGVATLTASNKLCQNTVVYTIQSKTIKIN